MPSRRWKRRAGAGGNSSGVVSESGVAGRGLCPLRPKRGKFLVDDRAAEMVRHRGQCSPKRRAHCRASGRGAREGSEGSQGTTVG